MAQVALEEGFIRAQAKLAESRRMTCGADTVSAMEECVRGIERVAVQRGMSTWVTSQGATTDIYESWRDLFIEVGIVCTGASPTLMVETGDIKTYFSIVFGGGRYWLSSTVDEDGAERRSAFDGPFDDLQELAEKILSTIAFLHQKSGGSPSKYERNRRRRRRHFRAISIVSSVCALAAGYYSGKYITKDPFIERVEAHFYDDVPFPGDMNYTCYFTEKGLDCAANPPPE